MVVCSLLLCLLILIIKYCAQSKRPIYNQNTVDGADVNLFLNSNHQQLEESILSENSKTAANSIGSSSKNNRNAKVKAISNIKKYKT